MNSTNITDALFAYGPWAALALYVFFSLLGHVRMTENQARAYPRLFSAVLFGQAIGLWITQAIYPLLGMALPSKAMRLVDAAFPPPAPATPPLPPSVTVDVPAAEPTQPSSTPPTPVAESSGGRRA